METRSIQILTVPVTPFEQNCRVLFRDGDPSATVIDPGGDADEILQALKKRGLVCSAIWLTHSHLDHCGGVKKLKAQSNAPLWGHPIEREMRARVIDIANMYGLPPGIMENCPEPDHYLSGGEQVTACGVQWEVRFTPGHAPGHICFYQPEQKILLAGDTLFLESIGRTDLPGGNHEQLLTSIREQILTLPPDTRVLPGHGLDTTVGHEKARNPFLS